MFKYSLIKLLRNKMSLFWILIFPLALMTAMHFAFDSIYDFENSIDPMKTVFIQQGEGAYQDSFAELIDTLSDENSEDQMFILVDADSLEDAKQMLADEEAEIIFVASEDNIEVYLQENHSITSAAVAGAVADSFKQRYTLIADAFEQDPALGMQMIDEVSETVVYTASQEDFFGTDPAADTYYTFIAHYDHLGCMGEGFVFPGANDNASGAAMLVTLAKYFSKHRPRHGIQFILLDAEEETRLGSFV